MSGYHTREAFDARMAERRANPRTPGPHAAFYHVSLMPGWEPIVAEQLALAAHVGLTPLKTFVITPPGSSVHRFLGMAERAGVEVDLLGTADDFGLCEGPTLDALWDWCSRRPEGAVTYFHTKGASAPNDPHKRQWRRVMARTVVADWRKNLELLQCADMVGVDWQHSRDYPHFAGNFWAARADWIASLQRPSAYRLSRPDFSWASHSWRNRMYCETWLGSAPWHHLEDRLGSVRLFESRVYSFPIDVPGLDYDKPLDVGDGIHSLSPVRWWEFPGAVETLPDGALPPAADPIWEARYENEAEQHKKTTRQIDAIPAVRDLFQRLRGSDSLREWSHRLGYAVEDDPTLHGGGLQVTGPGGWLNTHLDYDLHPYMPARRRALNLIAFLNPEWRPEWGGALCLCDPMGSVVRRIFPEPGKLVAFEVSDLSYHGVEPVSPKCPVERVTAAVYFLSQAGPQNTRRRAMFLPNRDPQPVSF